MTDDNRRAIDPHISNLERDVAVIRSEIVAFSGTVNDMRGIAGRQADAIDDLREQLANPALSASGRALSDRSLDNRERISRIEQTRDEPRVGILARLDDLEKSRDEWRGALSLVRAAVGTSIAGTVIAVVALILAAVKA